MCLALYIASEAELPLIDWDKNAPAFYVRTISSHDAIVHSQFQRPHVRYLGSTEGCGCGFILNGAEPDKLALIQSDRQKLTDYVRAALQSDPKVQVFGCWEGDQGMSPTRTVQLSLADLLTYEFEMNERILVETITSKV